MEYQTIVVATRKGNYSISLREYDTVARADNYFAEYRMLFFATSQ
jgi:hypothetical protein